MPTVNALAKRAFISRLRKPERTRQNFFFLELERDAGAQRPTPSKNKVSFPARPRHPQHSMLEVSPQLGKKVIAINIECRG